MHFTLWCGYKIVCMSDMLSFMFIIHHEGQNIGQIVTYKIFMKIKLLIKINLHMVYLYGMVWYGSIFIYRWYPANSCSFDTVFNTKVYIKNINNLFIEKKNSWYVIKDMKHFGNLIFPQSWLGLDVKLICHSVGTSNSGGF